MGYQLLMACTLPDTISAGLTLNRLLNITAYPAPDWTVTVLLRGKSSIDLACEPEGRLHRLSADAVATGQWLPGDYWYSVRAARAGEVVEVEQGHIKVMPDLAGVAEGYDGRTQAQTALEAIDAVLAKRATRDQERYRINNRELYRTAISDLLRLRSYYAEQVARERRQLCGVSPWGRTIRVRLK